MSGQSSIIDDLKTLRDEINLQIHLGSKEVQDEWAGLEGKWGEFSSKAHLSESADDIGDALGDLGEDLKTAFNRIRKAL